MRFFSLLLFVLCAARPAAAEEEAQGSPALMASVDARVELMSVIFRLAGNPEYNQPNSASPYAKAVAERFGTFRGHAVIETAARLRRERGVSFDAVISMALHVADAETLAERIPFDQEPERLDGRWRLDEARAFLEEARAFAREADFMGFFAEHEALFDAAASRMEARLAERRYVEWFDRFFGARPGATFHVYVGMLLGGGNYGCGLRFQDDREEITPVLGVYQFDAAGVPVIAEDVAGTVAHELCHSYTNALVDQHAEDLRPAAERIFAPRAGAMQRMAYGNWQTMMYESLVRACVARFTLATEGEKAAAAEVRSQHACGFAWTGELAELLAQYETGREHYPAFDDFMPEIVAFFERWADEHAAEDAEQAALRPRVTAMAPANGALDVDPDLAAIEVTFDRPMLDKMWSVVGGGPDFPEIAGEVRYDAECRVLTIPVRLAPDKAYRFWLNSEQYDSFRSREGGVLEPLEVTFRTRAE
ncbi:MAG: DUF4932 domain-containing protein [Planctomycetes bacterium]|nr:DUF4932 domain-containing protein [Planctomycetota bacterium]